MKTLNCKIKEIEISTTPQQYIYIKFYDDEYFIMIDIVQTRNNCHYVYVMPPPEVLRQLYNAYINNISHDEHTVTVYTTVGSMTIAATHQDYVDSFYEIHICYEIMTRHNKLLIKEV